MFSQVNRQTRKQTSKSPRQHSDRTWTTASLVKALHMRAHGTRHNTAAQSAELAKSTLSRYWQALPQTLQIGGSEGQILQWYQEYESRSLEEHHHTLLTHIEEELLSDWIVLAYQHFEPVGKDQITAKAKEIIKTQRGIEHTGTITIIMIDAHLQHGAHHDSLLALCVLYVLVCGGDMRAWYAGFRHRHPLLSQRTSNPVDKKRIDAQKDTTSIANYFRILRQFKQLDASSIFAADETGLDGDGARYKKVLTPKGAKRVYTRGKSYAEHTSIMSICCANGNSAPPCFAFKGNENKLDPRVVQQIPDNCRYVQQAKGYFIKTHFRLVLEHLFTFSSQFGSSDRHILFVIDGAKSHVDLSALEYAIQNNIHIVCLPSNTSHVLQVADLGLFGPFKSFWGRLCALVKEQRQRTGVRDKKITRMDIIPICMEAWNKAMTSSNIIAAFEKSGICPFNPEAYQVNKMDEPQQNTTCLEMIHAAIQAHPAIANESDIVPSVVRSLLPILNPPEADMPVDLIDKCTHCGTNLKKKRYQQMLNTKAGMLLTKVELVAMIAQHEKEEEEKKQTAASKKVAAAERKSHAANKKRSRSKKNDADAHANAGVDADGDHTDTDDDADKENHDPLPA
jgi:hypothetical protein